MHINDGITYYGKYNSASDKKATDILIFKISDIFNSSIIPKDTPVILSLYRLKTRTLIH